MIFIFFTGTTRGPRPGEVDGVDYTFLSIEDFQVLEKSGDLLESGIFDGEIFSLNKIKFCISLASNTI